MCEGVDVEQEHHGCCEEKEKENTMAHCDHKVREKVLQRKKTVIIMAGKKNKRNMLLASNAIKLILMVQ